MFYPVWKKVTVLLVVLFGIVFAMPNIITTPSFMPNKSVKFGLDLQGGAHLLLQVDEKAVFTEYYSGLGDTIRSELRTNRIGYKNLITDENNVAITLRKQSDVAKAIKVTKKIVKGIDISNNNGRLIYQLTDKEKENSIISVVVQTIEIVRRRIDATGTQEPLIQRQGNSRIVVQLPGVDNPDAIKSLLGKTAKMTFHLVDDKADINKAVEGILPPGRILLNDEDKNPYVLEKRVYLGGENLVDSQPSYSQNQPVVSFRFDSVGARKFGRLTTKAVGRRLAIVLDGMVISAPNINEPILGGSGIITGNFTTESAGELAVLLRAGALPAPLNIVEERSVGPGLGADSVASGKIASALALLLIILFMAIMYRRFGLYANVALIINMVLILAVLSALQATLTLPGIAGIVLTMGMAVDANVLIFERIREEFNSGAKVYESVENGFSTAYVTIIDANVTSLIAGVLLYGFGSGPIKGFAITLSIGIACSMFSAILITRWLLNSWISKKNPTKLPL